MRMRPVLRAILVYTNVHQSFYNNLKLIESGKFQLYFSSFQRRTLFIQCFLKLSILKDFQDTK